MRTYTTFGAKDSRARALLDALPTLKTSPAQYRAHMVELGRHLAEGVLPSIRKNPSRPICVICTVEDADFLARGLIESLEEAGFAEKIHLLCLWNKRVKKEGVSISPILREYRENFDSTESTFIVVKSIISGACVVKTNLTRAISLAKPSVVFVTAPVLLKGAEDRLAKEFPVSVSEKFQFVYIACDTEKDGENVRPGVGGSVYELLGLGNSELKNRYVPEIVKARRKHFFSDLASSAA